MESMYKELTGDSSHPSNRLAQQRIQIALTGEIDLITDFRHCNPGRPNEKYDVFWSEMELVINEVGFSDFKCHTLKIRNASCLI